MLNPVQLCHLTVFRQVDAATASATGGTSPTNGYPGATARYSDIGMIKITPTQTKYGFLNQAPDVASNRALTRLGQPTRIPIVSVLFGIKLVPVIKP